VPSIRFPAGRDKLPADLRFGKPTLYPPEGSFSQILDAVCTRLFVFGFLVVPPVAALLLTRNVKLIFKSLVC
jgi:hypothetical protein